MADWHIALHHADNLGLEVYEQALAGFVGGPVTTKADELGGNPRDGYARSVYVTASHLGGEMQLEMWLTQQTQGLGAPDVYTHLACIAMRAPHAAFATKLATWHALRDAFGALGCTDATLTSEPAPIVDEAMAAGETQLAAQLRADITAALVAQARRYGHVALTSPRADDIAAVLAAYDAPEHMRSVSLKDCGISDPAAAIARFPNVESLSFSEPKLDGRWLRGLALPKLESLYLGDSAIERLTRDELAGFPALGMLSVPNTPLRELDPDIIEVCPKLYRVVIESTPLAKDEAQLSALRARWKRVDWMWKGFEIDLAKYGH